MLDRLEWIGANDDVVARGPYASGVISHLAAMMGLLSMSVLWLPVNNAEESFVQEYVVMFVWKIMRYWMGLSVDKELSCHELILHDCDLVSRTYYVPLLV